MPVLSIGEIKYMITLHKKYLTNFFFTKFWIVRFFNQFWENLAEIRIGTGAKFRPQSGPKKTGTPDHSTEQCELQSIPLNNVNKLIV